MQVFEAVPKQWGNSLGITIPREVVKKQSITKKKKIRVFVMGDSTGKLKKLFGSLKTGKPTQKVMEEIDEGYD